MSIQPTSLTLREIRLPLKSPFAISSGTIQDRRIILVQVEDVDGAHGWGECVAGEEPNYSPETVDGAWDSIRSWVVPRVLGRTFEHPREIHAVLEQDFRGHRMAKAAVEMALWDMTAHKTGVSLSRLLGGTRERVDVGISLGIEKDADTLVQRAVEAVATGYRKIKIKIAPGVDLDRVRAVRDAVGADVALMVDANSAYGEEDFDLLVELDAFALEMIEQPLPWDDLLRHARLQERLNTPICLDETITSLDRVEDMVALDAGRIVNIKPGRVGGFTSALAIHDYCLEHNIPAWCGGMLESGVGRAHNVALASLPGFTLPGDLSPSSRYWSRDIVIPEWTMDTDGTVKVPRDIPGMGVEVDINSVEKLAVRQDVIG